MGGGEILYACLYGRPRKLIDAIKSWRMLCSSCSSFSSLVRLARPRQGTKSKERNSSPLMAYIEYYIITLKEIAAPSYGIYSTI